MPSDGARLSRPLHRRTASVRRRALLRRHRVRPQTMCACSSPSAAGCSPVTATSTTRLDAQLPDVEGPRWIDSLERAAALGARVMFDGHGLVIEGQVEVREALGNKTRLPRGRARPNPPRDPFAATLPELTRRMFAAAGPLDRLSRREGRLSPLTGSNFSRSHLVAPFLPSDTEPCRREQ